MHPKDSSCWKPTTTPVTRVTLCSTKSPMLKLDLCTLATFGKTNGELALRFALPFPSGTFSNALGRIPLSDALAALVALGVRYGIVFGTETFGWKSGGNRANARAGALTGALAPTLAPTLALAGALALARALDGALTRPALAASNASW